MRLETLRALFKQKNLKIVEVARRAGYSRQTVHSNIEIIQDNITVRALREIAAVAGAKVIITFEIPDDELELLCTED